nr:immunoglobulin light chain junction region [Macaca mulatta]
CQHYYSIPCSC